MIELELLGVEPNGERLSFNDPEGNRYSVPITDELRAALRKDIPQPPQNPTPISPREIQALFRAGKSVDEVAQICSMPASQLLALEHPIAAERQYTAAQARAYRQAHELGGLTIDELVTSRLIERGVSASGISWDAYREAGAPWTLTAAYTTNDAQHCAMWRVNTKAQIITALNDEAAWLTETQVPAPSSPWRAPNTPQIDPAALRDIRGMRAAGSDSEKNSGLDIPEYMAASASENDSIDIDSVLASLDSQRGTARPVPTDDFCDDDDEGSDRGVTLAETNADDDKDDEAEAPSAVLLAFPTKATTSDTGSSSSATSSDGSDTSADDSESDDSESASGGNDPSSTSPKENENESKLKHSDLEETELNQAELPMFAEESVTNKKKETKKISETTSNPAKRVSKSRRSRPTMPSWDEIVFGYSKDSDA